jgi:hypothetical protein
MRARVLAVACLVAACHTFDPIREVPHHHREVTTTAAAIAMILAENPPPQVFAIGEYHQTRNAIAATSPLARFTREIIGMLEPYADHLIVEAWRAAGATRASRWPARPSAARPRRWR